MCSDVQGAGQMNFAFPRAPGNTQKMGEMEHSTPVNNQKVLLVLLFPHRFKW